MAAVCHIAIQVKMLILPKFNMHRTALASVSCKCNARDVTPKVVSVEIKRNAHYMSSITVHFHMSLGFGTEPMYKRLSMMLTEFLSCSSRG